MATGGFELPEWIVKLAANESGDFDASAIGRRLASTGVVEMFLVGDDPGRPIGIGCRTLSSPPIWSEVLYESWSAPITTALIEVAKAMSLYDQLSRLHSALQDMELVGVAARSLADYRDEVSRRRLPWRRRPFASLGPVDAVLEVGIVTMYARPFTGRASVGKKWRPQSQEDRELHYWLIDARNKVHAHYDRTEDRSLVNINRSSDDGGTAVFAEVRNPIPTETLRAIVDLCSRQYQRFWDETGRLKYEIATMRPPES